MAAAGMPEPGGGAGDCSPFWAVEPPPAACIGGSNGKEGSPAAVGDSNTSTAGTKGAALFLADKPTPWGLLSDTAATEVLDVPVPRASAVAGSTASVRIEADPTGVWGLWSSAFGRHTGCSNEATSGPGESGPPRATV